MAKLRTQGTHLFAVLPDGSEVVRIECVRSITGISVTRDQIDTTCLDSDGAESLPGQPTPSASTIGIQFDPENESHLLLHQWFTDGVTVEFALGLADGTAAPTANSAGEFDLPESRTWLMFAGYVADFPWEFALNSVVENNISVQISGQIQLEPKVSP